MKFFDDLDTINSYIFDNSCEYTTFNLVKLYEENIQNQIIRFVNFFDLEDKEWHHYYKKNIFKELFHLFFYDDEVNKKYYTLNNFYYQLNSFYIKVEEETYNSIKEKITEKIDAIARTCDFYSYMDEYTSEEEIFNDFKACISNLDGIRTLQCVFEEFIYETDGYTREIIEPLMEQLSKLEFIENDAEENDIEFLLN